MAREGGIYVVRNQNTNTVLDENQGNNWVRAWGANGGDNQKWELNREGRGHRWWLRNRQSGRYLASEHEDAGAALRTSEEPFLWHISEDEGGYRLQIRKDLDLHIDVKDANRDDDTIVLLWERKGNNQVWHLEEA
ncbi:hypothetical protein TWF696_002899 [Orbilia brochopaga]|uniref:Ricin B lectin domain-containing protein n=1 Tax=Orbilia brochopaga TaxID=3140254 RepID=A0AAV9U335_9PEZI